MDRGARVHGVAESDMAENTLISCKLDTNPIKQILIPL